MSALTEIRAAITVAKATPDVSGGPFHRDRRWKVQVGASAELSIQSETKDRILPTMIDGCVVERTGAFPGWALVEI